VFESDGLKVGVFFDGPAFPDSSLALIHIPSSAEMMSKFSFSGCKSLASVTHDPGSKLRPTVSGLLVKRGFP
jgi:hypothetical protein